MKRSYLKRRTRLKPMSDKRKIENTTYKLSVAEWKREQISRDGYWQCSFKGKPYAPNEHYGTTADDQGRCIMIATDVHHKRGRGRYLCYKQFFMGLCRFHHDWCHNNRREAKKRGYIKF